VQDEIDCRIQLRPMSYHPSTNYALDHTVPPLQAPSPIPSVQHPLKHPTPPVPAVSLQLPVTYCVPTPKTDSPSNHFQPIAHPKPTPKDYPVTGSPSIRHITDFDVHHYIVFCHLRDYTVLHQVVTEIKIFLQGEPSLPPLT
jgi:hypothetical protein